MIVHLLDGTYELFRHFYGLRRAKRRGRSAARRRRSACCAPFVQMMETGATHIGVATDHVIESFRNELWAGYKTGEGIEPALWAQFHPLEEALVAMGVATWPMVELEADDGLASAAHLAALDPRVEKVSIWTPDKDLAQCVVGDRVVQVDRRSGQVRNAEAIGAKYGVAPESHPGLPRARRRFGRRISRHCGHRGEDGRDARQSLRPPRGISAGSARRESRSSRCCSRRWRRCGPTRRYSRTSTSCDGPARRRRFRSWAERLGDAKLLARVQELETKVSSKTRCHTNAVTERSEESPCYRSREMAPRNGTLRILLRLGDRSGMTTV